MTGLFSVKLTPMKYRSLLLSFMIMFVLSAAGCNSVLEPIEQRFLSALGADPARLALVALPGNGIEEVKLPTPRRHTPRLAQTPRPVAARRAFPLVIVFGGARPGNLWSSIARQSDRWGCGCLSIIGASASRKAILPSGRMEDSRLIYDYAASRADVDPAKIVVLAAACALFHRCTGQ